MKDIKMLNDNELEKVNGGEIESSNIVGYEHKWYDNEDEITLDCCMFGAPAIIK